MARARALRGRSGYGDAASDVSRSIRLCAWPIQALSPGARPTAWPSERGGVEHDPGSDPRARRAATSGLAMRVEREYVLVGPRLVRSAARRVDAVSVSIAERAERRVQLLVGVAELLTSAPRCDVSPAATAWPSRISSDARAVVHVAVGAGRAARASSAGRRRGRSTPAGRRRAVGRPARRSRATWSRSPAGCRRGSRRTPG